MFSQAVATAERRVAGAGGQRAEAERLAAQPALQRQLDRFVALLERRFEEFAALRKVSLKAIFSASAANSDSELQFGLNFMRRCFPKLSQQQKGHALRARRRGALGGSAGASAATG